MSALYFLTYLALAAGPLDSSGAARKLYDEWQVEDAAQVASQVLINQPKDDGAWLLVARLLHSRGEHLAALKILGDLDKSSGHEGDDIRPMVASSAQYEPFFAALETTHFRIHYIDKDEIVATYAMPVLESAYTHIGAALGLLPAERGEKIVVEIYPDSRALAGATGLTQAEIETSGTIAVCKFHRLMIISPLATSSGYAWADTLAHELTHLIIAKKSHNTAPIWLHEGIAKYYESAWKGAPGQDWEPSSETMLEEAVKHNKLVTFSQMHPSMAKLSSQEEAALAFAEVFTVIEYINKVAHADAVPKILAAAGSGETLDEAFMQVTGRTMTQIEQDWRKYLHTRHVTTHGNATLHKVVFGKKEEHDEAGHTLEPIADKQVSEHARLGELLSMRGHAAAAVVEYEKAYTRAQMRYPTLVYQLVRAYLDAGMADAAKAPLDAALKEHGDDGDLRLLAGRLAMSQHDAARATVQYEAARLQNPYNPEIHHALAALYDQAAHPEAAKEERHFLDLTREVRVAHHYQAAATASATTGVTIVTLMWKPVRIDGGVDLPSPIWRMPLAAGEHGVEFARADGKLEHRSFQVTAGKITTLVLR